MDTDMSNMVRHKYSWILTLYRRSIPEITQFTQSMNDLHKSWDLVKSNPNAFKPLFCGKLEPVTRHTIMMMTELAYSDDSSNRRVVEEQTVYSWETLLQDIEEKNVPVTFQELLSFAAGADHIPPTGFSKKLEISFFTEEQGVLRLPYVSTCAMS